MRQRVSISGKLIAFDDTGGSQRPVVLVHGNSSSAAAWSELLGGPLAARFRLLALDLPGCGESDRMAHYDFRTLSEILRGFAREARCEDAIFVGHSLGGHVLLEAAPGLARARGFAIIGTPPLGKPPQMDRAFLPTPILGSAFKAELTAEEIDAWAQAMVAPGSELAARLAADIRRTDPRLRSDVQQAVAQLGFTDEVEIVYSLGRPLAVLHGAADGLVNAAYFEQLAIPTLWRGAVQRIDGAGHYAQLERPAAFGELLEAFARSCT